MQTPQTGHDPVEPQAGAPATHNSRDREVVREREVIVDTGRDRSPLTWLVVLVALVVLAVLAWAALDRGAEVVEDVPDQVDVTVDSGSDDGGEATDSGSSDGGETSETAETDGGGEATAEGSADTGGETTGG